MNITEKYDFPPGTHVLETLSGTWVFGRDVLEVSGQEVVWYWAWNESLRLRVSERHRRFLFAALRTHYEEAR